MVLVKHDPQLLDAWKGEVLINYQEVDSAEIISENYYHDIVKEFNIHFGSPRSDTCDKCDSLQIRIDPAESDEDKAKLRT